MTNSNLDDGKTGRAAASRGDPNQARSQCREGWPHPESKRLKSLRQPLERRYGESFTSTARCDSERNRASRAVIIRVAVLGCDYRNDGPEMPGSKRQRCRSASWYAAVTSIL
jgi:hypothetical protein